MANNWERIMHQFLFLVVPDKKNFDERDEICNRQRSYNFPIVLCCYFSLSWQKTTIKNLLMFRRENS